MFRMTRIFLRPLFIMRRRFLSARSTVYITKSLLSLFLRLFSFIDRSRRRVKRSKVLRRCMY